MELHVKSINQVSWMYAPDRNGWTPIHYALHSKQGIGSFEYIIQHYGATSVDKLGRTILHHAALLGKLTACKMILEQSDSGLVNLLDDHKRTALHLATACGHGDVVQLLLAYQANPEIDDECGHSALTYARVQRLHFCLHLLTKHARLKTALKKKSVRSFSPVKISPKPIDKQRSQSYTHLSNQLGYSSVDSSSGSFGLPRDLWTLSNRSQSWATARRKPQTPTKQSRKERNTPSRGGGDRPGTPIKTTVYKASRDDILYQTRENLTIQDEDEPIAYVGSCTHEISNVVLTIGFVINE
ncbi:unnamed protein product [Echinostoma caproni]|uniref:ANK_REP_REGION domain-containing protein n=1 Tax=Echinostoma caproni TaxID=27848 RepID=A0A182ZZI0_9TREM|nr:unnamed protein product [Echinostoma caproni]